MQSLFEQHHIIRYAAKEHRSPFVLRSGKTSPYYVDIRKLLSHPSLCNRTVHQLYRTCIQPYLETSSTSQTYLCGLPMGAVPYAAMLAAHYSLPQLLVRKTPKTYGTQQMVEGAYSPGANVILVEDVVTTGGSVREVIEVLHRHEIRVVLVVSILYRGDTDQWPEFVQSETPTTTDTDAEHTRTIPYRTLYTMDTSGRLQPPPSTTTATTTPTTTITAPPVSTSATQQQSTPSWLTPSRQQRIQQLRDHIQTSSKICVAIDRRTTADIKPFIEALGPHVGCIKLHADMIEDFDASFVEYLCDAKTRFGCLFWEDRKLADIGQTMQHQLCHPLYNIAAWADIVSCHALVGAESLQALSAVAPSMMLVLIAQMSSAGNTLDTTYTQQAIRVAQQVESVVGIVCQTEQPDAAPLLTFVPGIASSSVSQDDCGQRYHSTAQKTFADVWVIGRAIVGTSRTPSDIGASECVERLNAFIECT